MDRTQMEEFVASAALLAAHLSQQCEQAAADQREAAGVLQDAATGISERSAAEREALLQATSRTIRRVLSEQLDTTTARADAATQRLEHLIAGFDRAQSGMAARSRLLGGGALLALVLAAVAIIGSSAYVARLNLERAERASVRAEVMEALQQVTITACDGRPCIKLEDGLRRWPSNDAYVFVESQQANL